VLVSPFLPGDREPVTALFASAGRPVCPVDADVRTVALAAD
jgi:hypothetical protein